MPATQRKLVTLKEELEEIRKEKMKGVIIRTKARWNEDGEKPSKYFCALEKRNYVNKTVTRVVDDNNLEYTKQDEILEKIKTFYKTLYSSRDETLTNVDLNDILTAVNIQKLNVNDASLLETDITLEEAGIALKKMKNNKTPGPDGFTSEFYKFFWKDIGNFLIRSWKFAFETKELSTTQRQGVITILPKGDKPREFLKKLEANIIAKCII